LVKGKVYSPEFNGKAERWFRTLKVWQRISLLFCSVGRVQQRLDTHRDWYNQVRCHQALAGRTPEEAWNGSSRPPPQPILERDPLRPVVEVRINGFCDDLNLPVVKIEVLRNAKQAA
ncbi:MAG: transposase, partial [Planctomycetes bacterium]|nr:transposase [Planctomycetota bacterium]